MNEKETSQNLAEETPKTGETTDFMPADELAMMNEWAAPGNAEEEAAAAKRIFDLENTLVGEEALNQAAPESVTPAEPFKRPEPATPAERKHSLKRAAIAGATTVGLAATGVATLEHFKREPVFSQETTTYTLQEGDSRWDAAQAIEGSDKIDMRDAVHYIEVNPANIDVLRGGLQPGEQLVIPVSVTLEN